MEWNDHADSRLASHRRRAPCDATDAQGLADGKIFRFWYNEDSDKGDYIGQLSDARPNWETDPNQARVKGKLDLINLFPVQIDVSAFRTAWGNSATFRLYDHSGLLRYCRLSGVSPDEASSIQTSAVETQDHEPLESAALHSFDPVGVEIGDWLDENGKAMLAVMAGGPVESWNALELVVSLGDREVFRYRLPLQIVHVREMYNWINSRHLSNDAEQRATWLGAPSCGSGKTLVFLHGANVSEDDAGKWGDALYKRLWWAGADVDFYNVDWRSDIGSSANYHENASNAFAVAEQLASTIAAIPGQKTIMAHSLGNMVVSSMIQDHGLTVSKYLMCNSAVPAEAYDPDPSLRVPQLVHPDWEEYPSNTWTASYHSLFDGLPDDRRLLGWPGLFADVAQYAVNFYSTGDEVLELYANNNIGILDGITSMWVQYSWHHQEMGKGRGIADGFGFTTWSGWGFDEDVYVQPLTPLPITSRRYTAEQAAAATDEQLRANPVFRPYPSSITNSVIPLMARAAHLTYGVPALTLATGRTAVGTLAQLDNFNLNVNSADTGIPKPNDWPTGRRYGSRWTHSDMKDVAYYFNFMFYEKVIEKGGLK